jgi:hypothetical protein
MCYLSMKKNKEAKVKLTNNNFGRLLLESVQEAVEYSRGKKSLNSVKLELPEWSEAEKSIRKLN